MVNDMVNMVKTGGNMVESGAGVAGLIPARWWHVKKSAAH